MRPFTDARPKALLEIGGKALLHHTLDKLESTGRVEELVLVVGYLADEIRTAVGDRAPDFPVTFVENERWSGTNSIYSLWLSRDRWGDGFVLLDSDIWFDDGLLAPLFEVEHDRMIIDRGRRFSEIDMKATVMGQRVWHLDKKLEPAETDGEFFGMSYFSPRGAQHLERVMAGYETRGELDTWYEWPIRDAAKEISIEAYLVAGLPWCEIDDARDLELAAAVVEALVE